MVAHIPHFCTTMFMLNVFISGDIWGNMGDDRLAELPVGDTRRDMKQDREMFGRSFSPPTYGISLV